MSPTNADNHNQRWHDQVDQDLYKGDGPGRSSGIITRIELLEAGTDAIRGQLGQMEETLKSINGKFWAIILGMLMILAGLSVDIAKSSFQQGQRIESAPLNQPTR